MPTTKTAKPSESTIDSDPLSRLIAILRKEGFTSLDENEGWEDFGERIYHRTEKILFVKGETVFVILDYPELDEIVLRKSVDRVAQMFSARSRKERIFSVLQATTVYVCIVTRNELPSTANLGRYVSTGGGAVLIPVIIVPEINQVVYPHLEEKIGTVRPRVEYLQYLIGERRDPVRIHAQTIRTFYVSIGVVAFLAIAAIVSHFL
jgi:hypothetical protein